MSRYFTFWRIIMVLILFGIGAAALKDLKYQFSHIARIEVANIIYADPARHTLLKDLAKNDNVRAVFVRIDSPGGLAGASEEIYEDLRAISRKKPVVALMGEVAASGGYIVALGADYILARPTTITGSIGVILQWADVSALAKKIGIHPYIVRSGALKAQPDFFEKPSPKTMRYVREIVEETFDWFVNMVVFRRKIEKAKLLEFAGSGRIFSGRQAVSLKLIDALGGEREAMKWLNTKHQISLDMPIENYKSVSEERGIWAWLTSKTLAYFGISTPDLFYAKPMGLMFLW